MPYVAYLVCRPSAGCIDCWFHCPLLQPTVLAVVLRWLYTGHITPTTVDYGSLLLVYYPTFFYAFICCVPRCCVTQADPLLYYLYLPYICALVQNVGWRSCWLWHDTRHAFICHRRYRRTPHTVAIRGPDFNHCDPLCPTIASSCAFDLPHVPLNNIPAGLFNPLLPLLLPSPAP